MLARMSSRLRSAPPSSPPALKYVTRMRRMGPDQIEETSEEPRANVNRVARLDLVVQFQRYVDRLGLDQPRHGDAPVRPALCQSAGKGDRLLDGQAGIEH